MTSVTWLHLTDLHVGMPNQNWQLPNFRELLFEDLRRVHDRAGPWDLVVFSGDIAQSGSKDEYQRADQLLGSLWEHLRVLGSTPLLVVTPGNHDLVRPAANDPTLRAILHWHDDSQVKAEFWQSSSNPYRQLVVGAFENYVSWRDALSLPKPLITSTGLMPGDYSCSIEKAEMRVGIVTLNSSFLQLTSDSFDKRLDLDVRQLVSACEGDHVKWASGLDIALLVTHHPPGWLHPASLETFDSGINPPGRFFLHFCGHLHEPLTLNSSLAGAAVRRLRQGPSLFGLDNWGNAQKRIHGYSAGRLTLAESEITETIWPRIARHGYAGHLRLVADTGYDLNEDGAAVWTYVRGPHANSEQGPSTKAGSVTPQHSGSKVSNTIILLDEVTETRARTALERVPRTRFQFDPHHRRVRRLDQATCEKYLEEQRCVWILSDWGLGTDAFMGTVIGSLSERSGLRDLDVFAVRCDDASNIESLRGQTHRQLGLPLQQFLSLAASIPGCVLVMENVTGDLLDDRVPGSGTTFDDVILSILDYCPKMRIILTARSVKTTRFECVELKALDPPDIRTYVLHHPKGGDKLAEADAVEILYRRSAGLPIHLDRLLEALKYMSLAELSDPEYDSGTDSGLIEAVPRALERAVSGLAQSRNKYTQRSFNLLKVLTVLADGETLQKLRHFDQADPFFPANASELESLQLIQIVPLADLDPTSSRNEARWGTNDTEKLLIAPRQVRDYVRPLIHPSDQIEIIKRGADIVFGPEWREGRLRNAYFRNTVAGQRNEAIILKHLLSDALKHSDEMLTNRVGRLAASVCEGLDSKDRYRETATIAEAVLPALEMTSSSESTFEVSTTYAKCLRMLGHRKDAIKTANRILDEGAPHLSAQLKTRLYLNLALAYDSEHNSAASVDAARKVQEFAHEGSASYLQAEGIIAEETLTGPELIAEWTRLEKTARQNNYLTTANNLALDLARTVGGVEAKKLRERVLNSEGDAYNHLRALVAKAKDALATDPALKFSPHEMTLLGQAYSYLHRQRMAALFETCHDVLWQALRSVGRWDSILRLFRHSSFVWRIFGKLNNEKRYVEELASADLNLLRAKGGSVSADIAYLEGRRIETLEP